VQKRNSDMGLSDNTRRSERSLLLHRVGGLLLKLSIFAVSLLLVFGYLFGLLRYANQNMRPSFQDGDLILFFRLADRYYADEVVVVEYGGERLLERVIAVEGDEVNVTADGLSVNGSLVTEPRVLGETTLFEGGESFPVTVPQGKIFVLGDNREQSVDSRIFGCVDTNDVYGRVIGVFRRRNL